MFMSWLPFLVHVLSFPISPLKKERSLCNYSVCVYIHTDTYIHAHPNIEDQNICSFHKLSALLMWVLSIITSSGLCLCG